MLNEKQLNLPKIQKLKFYCSFNNFGRDPPQEYPWILRSKSGVLSEEMSFETFTPIWCHASKNEKKKKNSKNPKFQISQFFEQLW